MKYLKKEWKIYILISITISILGWFQGCIVSDINDQTKMSEIFKFHFTRSQFISLAFNLVINILWFFNSFYMYSK